MMSRQWGSRISGTRCFSCAFNARRLLFFLRVLDPDLAEAIQLPETCMFARDVPCGPRGYHTVLVCEGGFFPAVSGSDPGTAWRHLKDWFMAVCAASRPREAYRLFLCECLRPHLWRQGQRHCVGKITSGWSDWWSVGSGV